MDFQSCVDSILHVKLSSLEKALQAFALVIDVYRNKAIQLYMINRRQKYLTFKQSNKPHFRQASLNTRICWNSTFMNLHILQCGVQKQA